MLFHVSFNIPFHMKTETDFSFRLSHPDFCKIWHLLRRKPSQILAVTSAIMCSSSSDRDPTAQSGASPTSTQPTHSFHIFRKPHTIDAPRIEKPSEPIFPFSSATDQMNGEMVAIKKMTNVFSHVAETKRTLREVRIRKTLLPQHHEPGPGPCSPGSWSRPQALLPSFHESRG